jgi:DUF4097 and DUF4098 domain-containing protein YvlB
MRPILILLATLPVLAFLGCSTSTWTTSSTSDENKQLPIRRPIDLTSDVALDHLDLNLPYSSITITSGPSISRLHITGHIKEATENEASVQFTSTGPRLITHTNPPGRFDGITLEVPPSVDLDCVTAAGAVSAAHLAATKSVRLKSAYGSITLADCAPLTTVKLTTSAGAIIVKQIQSFHDLHIHSDYGHLELADVTGDNDKANLKATTSSGSITLNNVRKCDLAASSSYGSVTLQTGADFNAVNLSTSSGHVRAADLDHTGNVTLKSSYGAIELANIPKAANIDAHTASGSISVDHVNAKGANLATSYGSIHLAHCSFATLSTNTSSGKVSQSDVSVQR